MASVNLTKCDEVSKAELARLHDQQVIQRALLEFFLGKEKFKTDIVPLLVFKADNSGHYLDLPL